jgi:hypothetical protein
LAPNLLTSETETLFAHAKRHWDNIQVGYGAGNQVRFILNKKRVEPGIFSVNGKQTITVQHEIPANYTIVEKHDCGDWKGVVLKLVEFPTAQEEFGMS